MPDWSYRTVFRPLLFRLRPKAARDLALGVMGTLGRSPIGPFVIDFMGHMNPDPRLARTLNGVTFPSAVGFGCGIDIDAFALPALARFGFGFIELGPITVLPAVSRESDEIERTDHDQSIAMANPPENIGAAALATRLAATRSVGLPLVARLATIADRSVADAVNDVRTMIAQLSSTVTIFALDPPTHTRWTIDDWSTFLDGVIAARRELAETRGLWLVVPPDLPLAEAVGRVEQARSRGIAVVLVDGGLRDATGCRLMGRPVRATAQLRVRELRERFGSGLSIVASGGVHEPADALDLIDAGADLVEIDSGLVFSGPGLPKRVNEAVLFATHAEARDDSLRVSAPARRAELTWFWFLLLGLSMCVGSSIALVIAATRVVLPYDEHFVGLPRTAIAAANPRLLGFMTHDRVTLAGAMVTIGVMYAGLSWFGIRRGEHWAMKAVAVSGFAGFASFFLFLGFGYFDPFHAFVTSVLLQLMLLGIHSRLSPRAAIPAPSLHDDARWRRSLWGQLLFIVQAVSFIVAGLVISGVGITSVFVPEDLQFMKTDAHKLGAVSPHLVPLIAHDRASFGGMLISAGLVFLTSSLWGFRRGSSWLWWTTLVAGLPGYLAAILVHYAVGYENLWHLTPAFAGLALFVTGLWLSYPYLCSPDVILADEWARRLRRVHSES